MALRLNELDRRSLFGNGVRSYSKILRIRWLSQARFQVVDIVTPGLHGCCISLKIGQMRTWPWQNVNADRRLGAKYMRWAVVVYLVAVGYILARLIQLPPTSDTFPTWEFGAVKSFQLLSVPLFLYGLFRWLKGFNTNHETQFEKNTE